MIEKETSLEPKKSKCANLNDFDCWSGFQPRSCNDGYKANFFFAAGSRSHEKVMDGYRADSYPVKSTIEIYP
jgi:hypothetical protein